MLNGDGNENGKQTHRSNWQNLHVQHTFLYISLPCFARLQRDTSETSQFKVARYSFSESIPPKFEHKLRRHKQGCGKVVTTVVLDKDENLL